MKSTRETSKKRKAPAEGAEKRQRVSLACEYCRSRKQRCDSGRPSCSACKAAGQQCVYDEKIRRRGLVPGYVRVLECLFGALFSRVDSAEDALTNLLNDGAIWPADSPEEGSDQGGDSNALFQRWKKSKVCQVIEGKLNDNEVSVDSTAPFTPGFEQDISSLAARTPGTGGLRSRGMSQHHHDPRSSMAPVTATLEQDYSRTTARNPDVGVVRGRGLSQLHHDPRTATVQVTSTFEHDRSKDPARDPDVGIVRDRGLSQPQYDPRITTAQVTYPFEHDRSKDPPRNPDAGSTRDRGHSQPVYDPRTIKASVTSPFESELHRVTSRTPNPSAIQDYGPFQSQSVPFNLREVLTTCTGWERAAAIANSGISLVLPSNSWRLFDIFFTFTACWLPLVERRYLFKMAESYGDGPYVINSRLDRTSHSVLWAVMAYASYQDRSSKRHQMDADGTTPDQLFAIASSLISDPFEVASLEQSQALILLSLINCGRGEFTRAWQQIGGAASSIRCHPDATSTSSKAIRSCCYIIDALVSVKCGLRQHLAGEEVPHVDVDGVEEYERWINRTDIRGEANVQTPRAIPQRLYSTFNTLLDLVHISSSSHSHYDRANALSDWYNNFCTSNRQAFSASGIFSSPGLAHTIMVYHFLHCKLATGDTHTTDMVNIAASWQEIFGQATLPPTFALFLVEGQTACRAVFTSPSDEKGAPEQESVSESSKAARMLDTSATHSSVIGDSFMIMPNTNHVPNTLHEPESQYGEPNNLFSNANSAHHQPHRSIDNTYGATIRSEPVHMHLAVDLDEWMYDLAPRPEFNDQSAFMMNLGAIGGHATFDNMFAYTDLS